MPDIKLFLFPSGESVVSLDLRHPLTDSDVNERGLQEDIELAWKLGFQIRWLIQ